MLTPQQRALRARMGAYAMHSQGKTNLAPARAAFDERFERQVDPQGTLPEAERARRAEQAKKAYFAGLALKSAAARRKARELAEQADAAERELAEMGGGDDRAA